MLTLSKQIAKDASDKLIKNVFMTRSKPKLGSYTSLDNQFSSRETKSIEIWDFKRLELLLKGEYCHRDKRIEVQLAPSAWRGAYIVCHNITKHSWWEELKFVNKQPSNFKEKKTVVRAWKFDLSSLHWLAMLVSAARFNCLDTDKVSVLWSVLFA